MKYCTQCGHPVEEDAKFCCNCGNKLTAQEQQVSEAIAQPVSTGQSNQGQNEDALNQKFAAVKLRYRCTNGHVFDANSFQSCCPNCGTPIEKGGIIQMYRMGNYMGMAVGMGIYIDGIPYGHIGNRESVRICVPYGAHKVHVTHTTTRACNDPTITVTPEVPYSWCKASFGKMGFKINVEPASEDSMPAR